MQKFLISQLIRDMIDERTKQDIGIRTAAEACGLSTMNFQQIEAGKTPKIEHLLLICHWLDKNVSHYFSPVKSKKK